MHDPNIESHEAFIERMAGADLPKEDILRSHLEAQERLAYDAESGKTLVWGDNPDDYFRTLDCILREIQEHAVAALAILDNAAFGFDIDHGWREDRLIPDPGMNPELDDPDPVPVESPRPNERNP